MSIAKLIYRRKSGLLEEAVQVKFRHLSKYMSIHTHGGWDKTLKEAVKIEKEFKEILSTQKPFRKKSNPPPVTPNVYVGTNGVSIVLVLSYPDSKGVRKQVTRSLSVNPLKKVLRDYRKVVDYYGNSLPPMSKLYARILNTINDRYKLEKERGVTLRPILLGYSGYTEYHPDSRLGEYSS